MSREGGTHACALLPVFVFVFGNFNLGAVKANDTLFTTFHLVNNARAEGMATRIGAETLTRCAARCQANPRCNVAQHWSEDHTCDLFDGVDVDIVYPLLTQDVPRTVLIKATLQAFYVRREDRASMTYDAASDICTGLGGTMATRDGIESTFDAFPFQKETCCSYVGSADWGVQVGVQTYEATTDCFHAFKEVYCKPF